MPIDLQMVILGGWAFLMSEVPLYSQLDMLGLPHTRIESGEETRFTQNTKNPGGGSFGEDRELIEGDFPGVLE